MPLVNSFTLVVNALTLIMALQLLLLIFWRDARKERNQFLGVFLITVSVWSMGSLLALAMSTVNPRSPILVTALGVLEIGFVSSSIAIYAFTAVSVGVMTRRFRVLLLVGWAFLLAFQVLVAVLGVELRASVAAPATSYRLGSVPSAFYLLFTGATFYLQWRYRVRIASLMMRIGIFAFLVGQVIGLLYPEQTGLAVAIVLSSLAALLIGVSVLRQEVIIPLTERTSQVKTMHEMTLAITSQLAIDVILDQVAKQTAERLNADGVGVFLRHSSAVQLAAVAGLPRALLKTTLPSDTGIVGQVITSGTTIHLENYERDWHGPHDLPLAVETFGALLCVPLNYAEATIGAIMVVAGKRKQAFRGEDVYLLEMLAAQAAVAITHGRLFTQQRILTEEIASARNQLETLLASTENPVIAVNRNLEMIFANKAAERLFPSLRYTYQPVDEILPRHVLPSGRINVYRDIRRERVHTYEVVLQDRVYMTHLAAITQPQNEIQGWVAVLNDITDLKELDRIKSEMVRMTSHDLKNPLQAAMLNVDLLRDSLKDAQDEDVAYSIRVIEKHLNRMFRIISGVLDVERVRAGSRSLTVCHPRQVIENAVADMRHLAEDSNITLTCTAAAGLPTIQGDAGQLERALANLIENAIKFTPRQGCVNVSVTADDRNVTFAVEDNGIGIPQADQSEVFESFFRANQKGAEHITGTGLGLHLVKTIVENHDGSVWLESEESIGTTVYISIPTTTEAIV